MSQYVVYKGKSVKLDQSSNWQQRVNAQNSQVRKLGITGVDFSGASGSWPDQLERAGAQKLSTMT
jgi:hypothetical protein